MLRSRFVFHLTVFVVLAGAIVFVQGGPLSPPAGPVASTVRFGPRIEITSLPAFIGVSGSYYLGQTLFGTPGADGITIGASDVDIDLDGFELVGGPGSLSGIVLLPGFTTATVHDGQVRDWGGDGVNVGAGERNHVYNITAESNGGTGVSIGFQSIGHQLVADSNTAAGIVTAGSAKLTDCVASENSGVGIFTGPSTHVSNCTTFFNLGNGFTLLPSSVAIGCTAESNSADGFNMDANCRASNCTALRNGTPGFFGSGFNLIGGNASVQGCTAQDNFENGFVSFAFGCSATDCVASMNGLPAGFGSGIVGLQTVIGCTASGNLGDGIFVMFGTAKSCTANSNADDGIEGFNSLIESCQTGANGDNGIEGVDSQIHANSSNDNLVHGIAVLVNCQVVRNNCKSNGLGGFGSGIVAFGPANNIEANHCVANAFGAAIDTITFAAGLPNAILSNRETGNPFGYLIDFGANSYGSFYFGPTGAPVETFPAFGGITEFANITY